MNLRAFLLLVLAPIALPQVSARTRAPEQTGPTQLLELRFGIQAELVDGDVWLTVRTQDAPLRGLLEELSAQTGVQFAGIERIPASVRVTADLEHRPLRQTVSWILGSVGLRADRRLDTFTLHVDADTREDLITQARTEYLRTLREFPNHALADRTIFGQGLLEEDRGQPVAARAHYDALVEAYPESPMIDDALKRCAELFAAEREWAMAAQRWAQLLRLETETPFEVLAYEQLALATALLGDSNRAIHMLDALENLAPAESDDEHQARLYIRARSLLGQRFHHRALEALAEADAYERSAQQQLTSHELRSRALHGLEEHGAASRSWLAYCELAEGDDLAQGLQQAAAEALLAGDELGVLFIERLAVARGAESAVAEEAREARARLDLVSSRLSGPAEIERLARAERLLTADLHEEAAEVLDALLPSLEFFEGEERARFILAYGRALGATAADPAITFFRDNLPTLPDPEHRTRVYLLAAELYEAEGRIDEAIEAYRGRL